VFNDPVRSVVLFLHITGALALFVSLGLEQASLIGLRRWQTTGRVREALLLVGSLRRLEGPGALIILATGIYMGATRWGQQPWIGLSLLAMVAVIGVGGALARRQATALARELPADDAPVPAALAARLPTPALRMLAAMRLAFGLGIVFVMVAKPTAAGTLVVLAVALAAGTLAGMSARRPVAVPR
jgi:hypothetical protein